MKTTVAKPLHSPDSVQRAPTAREAHLDVPHPAQTASGIDRQMSHAATFGHRFERIGLVPGQPQGAGPIAQVTPANDRYEQEADRAAAQVTAAMESPASAAVSARPSVTPIGGGPAVQRAAAGALPADGSGATRTPAETGIGSEGGPAPVGVIEGISDARAGQPLPRDIRQPAERTLGADFSGVRVHTSGLADQLNRQLNSDAFAHGRNLFFRRDAYDPDSLEGKHLIAHELAHVLQQRPLHGSTIQRGRGVPERLKAKAKAKLKKRSRAEDRLKRWLARGEARQIRGRIRSGRYTTPTGPGTLSGMFGQRMAQTRKGDYGGLTLGSLPPYDKVRANVPDSALPTLLGRSKLPGGLTKKQKLATTLASLLVHGSEEDREPGSGKYIRALIRQRIAEGTAAPNPFDEEVNPAVGEGGAGKMRDLLAGAEKPSKKQKRAIDEYASDSSDEEDDYYPARKSLWKERDD